MVNHQNKINKMKIIKISDLPCCNDISAEYVQKLEISLAEWVESLIPFYMEMKSKDANVFECCNVLSPGSPHQCYVSKGINYWFAHTALFGNTLALDGHNLNNGPVNWREYFVSKHPELFINLLDHYSDEMRLSSYFFRYLNIKPKYEIIAKRVDEYFKSLTGDSVTTLSLGGTSFICSTPDIVMRVNNHYSLN